MIYVMSGASGFIGKRLVKLLLRRPDATLYFLIRSAERDRIPGLRAYWEVGEDRAIALEGDITQPLLGLSPEKLAALRGKVAHFFHLAALYDLAADAESQRLANAEGTRNAIRTAGELAAGCFHHVSTIAVAGLYEGVFREDMFDEATGLDHPYFATKHEAEKIVRAECAVPWRIYRPGMVVGDSRTGETDKADGPYFAFKPIQKLRRLLPSWFPAIAVEGGRLNIVPVDFVTAALDHLAHAEGQDGRCFHLTDPEPHRVGEIFDIFARAGHAPAAGVKINAAVFGLIPRGMMRAMMALTPVRRIRDALIEDLGLPDGLASFLNWPTRFDCRHAQALLAPAGIEVPRLEEYAWRLWDYWERHLDPDLSIAHSLQSRMKDKVALVTGGSSGIGRAVAFRLAEAGAKTIICGRDQAKLDQTCAEAARRGLVVRAYPADLTEPDSNAAFAERLQAEQGAVDLLVNNAGRSIRRAIEESYDRFHDFERTMQINYFGALRLTLALLPGMAARGSGHVVNISSIGVLTNAPRFSAYVASKAALEAWTRCAAAEFFDRGVEFSTVNLPLVRTAMVAPTKFYDDVPMLSVEQAADIVVEALIARPERLATRLGVFAQLVHAAAPRLARVIMNTMFRMFPETGPASPDKPGAGRPTADQMLFLEILKGLHF